MAWHSRSNRYSSVSVGKVLVKLDSFVVDFTVCEPPGFLICLCSTAKQLQQNLELSFSASHITIVIMSQMKYYVEAVKCREVQDT